MDLLQRESEWFARLARGLLKDVATADDLMQETWLAALDASGIQSPRAWLAGVLRRRILYRSRGEARRRLRERSSAPGEALPSTEKLVERAELQRQVAAALVALDEPYRTTVMLHYFEELDSAEIARRQAIPAGTVRSRLKRGLDRLRTQLDTDHGGDRSQWVAALAPFVRVSVPSVTAWSLTGVLAVKFLLPIAAVLLVATAAFLMIGSGDDALPKQASRANREPQPTTAPSPALTEDSGLPEKASVDVARAPMETEAGPSKSTIRTTRLLASFVDPQGQPVSGAELESEQPELRAQADTLGRFDEPLELEHALTAEFRASANGFAFRYFHARLETGATVSLGEIVLVPAGSASGLVLDPDGRPLEGARVVRDGPEGTRSDQEELRRQGPELEPHAPATRSDASGRFRIDGIPQGPARIWAGADGLAWQSTEVIDITRGRDRPGLTLQLEPLRADDWISGLVLDPDGDPVEQAWVRYFFISARIGKGGAVETDAEKRFSFLVDHRAPHDFTVSDSQDRFSNVVQAGVEPGVEDLVFRFIEANWFELAVVDDDGAPVERFHAKAMYNGPGHSDILEWIKLADHELGVTRMRRPTRAFELTIDAPGFTLHTQGPIAPATVPDQMTIRVSRLPAISGRVLSERGQPVPSAQVELHEVLGDTLITVDGHRSLSHPRPESEGQTDEEGWFDLYLRGRGRFVLTAEKSGYARAERLDLELDGSRGAEGLEILMGQGGALEGRVIAPSAADASGVILSFNHGDGMPITRRTGTDGRYRVEGLVAGPWLVRVAEQELHQGSRSTSYSSGTTLPPMEWSCRVFEGQTTVHDVHLLAEGQAQLSGLFLFGGRAASGFTASLWDYRVSVTTGDVRASTVIGGGGQFTLSVLEPGPYTLMLKGNPGNGEIRFEEQLDLRPGEARFFADVLSGSLRLTAKPPPSGNEQPLEYRWEEPADGPRKGALKAVIRILPDIHGQALLNRLPAGVGSLWLYQPSNEGIRYGEWSELKRVEIAAGLEARVDLTSGQ